MCEPLTLLALAGTAAAAGISYEGQQATVNAQNKANADWVAYQRAQAAKAQAQDETLRQQSAAAAAQSQAAASPQAQAAQQAAQQQNLESQFTRGTVGAAADQNRELLGGQTGAGAGVSQDISDAMGARITAAARAGQDRIKALAALSSYGGGYGGVASNVGTAITQGNQNIALAGDMRTGVAKTLGVAQGVQPIQYTQGSNIAGDIAGSLAGVAGNAFGSAYRAGQIKMPSFG
jgi:hypothetical protein